MSESIASHSLSYCFPHFFFLSFLKSIAVELISIAIYIAIEAKGTDGQLFFEILIFYKKKIKKRSMNIN